VLGELFLFSWVSVGWEREGKKAEMLTLWNSTAVEVKALNMGVRFEISVLAAIV